MNDKYDGFDCANAYAEGQSHVRFRRISLVPLVLALLLRHSAILGHAANNKSHFYGLEIWFSR